jgi:hypothetical protein
MLVALGIGTLVSLTGVVANVGDAQPTIKSNQTHVTINKDFFNGTSKESNKDDCPD